jgi:hypothetical protein
VASVHEADNVRDVLVEHAKVPCEGSRPGIPIVELLIGSGSNINHFMPFLIKDDSYQSYVPDQYPQTLKEHTDARSNF